jgi:MerR family transcriptional regulator, copper efflux regulator
MPANVFTIGEAAARAGVSPDTVRYYERQGALPLPLRTAAGYRVYSEDVVDRIRLVKNAVAFGFAVKELAGFLRACDAGHPPCHKVRHAGVELLAAMERRLEEMRAARDQMRDVLERWDQALDRMAPNAPARLLSSIPSSTRHEPPLRRR